MAHVDPREWHPKHKLDLIHLSIHLNPAVEEVGPRCFVLIHGASRSKRSSLWKVEHEISDYRSSTDADEVAFFSQLVIREALASKITSQEALDRALAPPAWDQPQLEF